VLVRSPLRHAVSVLVHRATILGFVAFAVFPFYWMVVTTFKQNADLYVGATNVRHNPFIFNRPPTLDHLATLFGQTLYVRWLSNTLLVGVLVVLVTLLLAVPAGYSLARLTGRWGERLSIGIFLTYLVPSTLLFIPFSRLVSLLGLQNSLWSLVLVYPTFTVPFCTWLLMGFFKSLPKEVEESAMVDGCSRLGAIWRMVLPLSVPGLLTVVIFALTLVIQEFVYSLTFISSVERMTVSVGVPVALVRGDVYYWGSLMAACLITSIPIAVLYNFFLDRFIAGFTVGAIK
jgi:multiple sugar transport system permease protein